MKKFIVISLLWALAMPMMACIWYDTTNPYLFSMYEQKNFKQRVEEICNNNWKAYLGSTEAYYWFNADDAIKTAQQKGDALMVSYLQYLKMYLDCVDVERRKQYEWDYPTPQDISAQQRKLQIVRLYALGKIKTKLRSQHALLYMRCNMMLGKHKDNITFWEQTASQFINTVYKDMMKNIYAGALYKTGRTAEAGELFAEMDDYESLMTIYYKKRSFLAISQQYKQNPNAKVLPFLLQDFVNNAQEAQDAKGEGAIGGKLFIRDINQQESRQMQQFCDLVVSEGKSATPVMWKCAKAWLEFLEGKQGDAMQDIDMAMQLEGTQRMKDNARVLRLFINASMARPSNLFDAFLTQELTWLLNKKQEGDGFFGRAISRLSYQALVPHYKDKPEQLLSLMLMTSNADYDSYIDTMSVAQLEKFYRYAKTPAEKPFDRFLQRHIEVNDSSMIELIGTKHMRLAHWDEAVKWLSQLPVAYYNHVHGREYLYYSTARKYTVEPWITRQWLDSSKAYEGDHNWQKNVKIDFCKEMLSMEASLNVLQGKALEQRYYDLAVRYAQASIKGDCWWLLRNYKSAYDSVRVNEVDFGAKAVELLQKAATTRDKALKTQALFAMGWQELYNATPGAKLWTTNEWSDQASEYVRIYNRQCTQFRAFQGLFDMVDNTAGKPAYVAKCDEYEQFRQYYSKHKNGI